MAATELFAVIAVVVALAIAAELLGSRFGIPNFLFFVLAGILIGPPGLGLVRHQVFGEGLAVVVGLGVAIIIFHSGASTTREVLRGAPRMAIFLVTVGIAITFLGASALTYLALDVTPGVALLIGALLVPTGTTVIEPLLESVPLPDRLAYPLEIEALVTEVTAGILSIAVFYGVTFSRTDPEGFALLFAWHLVAGLLVGAGVAGVVWLLFQYPEHAPEKAPEHASQLYLASAVVAFAIAENVAREAGVAAVAIAGLLLGNADLPYKEHITNFEEDFVAFVLAFIFVVLAAFVDPEWLRTIGLRGLLVAIGVIVLVRPLAILVSSAGSVLTLREKAFLSTVSPRGIIPAGLATLIAIEIRDPFPDVAATITGTVLLVILASTLVEGVIAYRAADWLGVTAGAVVIVGGGRLGLALADRYEAQGERVNVVEADEGHVEIARSEGFSVFHGDGTEEAHLREAGIERANRVVAATDDDATNLEVARLVRSEFDVDTVLTRLNRGDNREMFGELDVELLTGSQLDLWALDHLVDRSAPDWLLALTRTGGVGVASIPDGLDGTELSTLDRSLPERAFVVALTRDGDTWIPDASERVAIGDRVTVLGRADDVEEALAHLDPSAHGDGRPARSDVAGTDEPR